MNPPKLLTDPTFDYTRSDLSDIRDTFRRLGWEAPSQQKLKPKPEPKTQGPIDIQRRKTA